ncbi:MULTISPECIES: hypothetical protein [Pseudoalteromonas]|uniref:hypothetical protein n=1 Tax=Pseudoalteromonas TaxID=53246 RepID=UPI00101EC643|nr:hypothetical protein [Pseudoalteromonas sp. MEBiC 03485]RZD19716.1 hypothetical protein EVU92_21170 [Pseudoalteromonas sp. MEBiC 03485]
MNVYFASIINGQNDLRKRAKVRILNILSFTCCTLLVGCSLTQSKTLNVGGQDYLVNKDGSITVSKEQVQYLKGQSDITVIDTVMPAGGVAVTEQELQLLSKDKQLLTETIDGKVAGTEIFTFLVKQGSLKENLSRLTAKYSTENEPLMLDYGDVDYYVKESSIIRAYSVDELVGEVISSFPAFAQIDGVTFFVKKGSLKANLNRLSEQYSTPSEPLEIDYNGGDLHVAKSELIVAGSLEELVSLILAPYPVFSAIE